MRQDRIRTGGLPPAQSGRMRAEDRWGLSDSRDAGGARGLMSCIRRALRFGGEGRGVGAQWRPPEAHKPGRRSPAVGEPVGGHGDPNAARLGGYQLNQI